MEEKEKTEKARREKLLSAATKPAEVISTKIPIVIHNIICCFLQDPSPLLSMLKPDEKVC